MSRSWRSLSAVMMSFPTRRPAVVIVGPNSEFSATMSLKSAPLTSRSRSSSGSIRGAIATGDALQASGDPHAERGDRPYAILDLGEFSVMIGPRQLALCEHVELVGSEYPGLTSFPLGTRAPLLDLSENCPRIVAIHLLPGVEMRELREPDRDHSGRQDCFIHIPKVGK